MMQMRNLLLGILCVCVLGCSKNTAEHYISAAKLKIEKKETKAAIIQLKNALEINPSLSEARFLLGKLFLEGGDVSGASIELKRAADLGYPEDEVAPKLAASLLFSGEYEKLFSTYGNVNLANPAANADLKSTLAAAQAIKGKYKEARLNVDAALASKSDYVPALLLDARLLARTGQADAAFASIDKTIAANAEMSAAWVLRGEMLNSLRNDKAAALQAYQKAILLDEKSIDGLVGAIHLLMDGKQLEEAQKLLDRLIVVGPRHPNTYLIRGTLALQKGDLRLAQEQVQMLMQLLPNDPRAQFLSASVASKRHDYVQAQVSLSKLIQNQPNNQATRNLLARTYLQLGNPAKAVETLQVSLNDTKGSSEAFGLAAEAYLQMGEMGLAERAFARVASGDQTDARSRVGLAMAKARSGEVHKALTELAQLTTKDESGLSDLALIGLHHSLNDLPSAMVAISALELKQPKSSGPRNLRGNLELKLGNKLKARQAFEQALAIQPSDGVAAQNLAILDLEEGHGERAIGRFEKQLTAAPNNVNARLALINVKAQMGASTDELVRLGKEAITLHPNEPGPRVALAFVRARADDDKLALQAAQEGLAAFSSNAELYDYLGRAHLRLGDTNQALQAFARMAELQPSSAVPHMRQFEVHMQRKDAARAKAALVKALTIRPAYLPAQINLGGLLIGTKKYDEAIRLARKIQSTRKSDSSGWILEGDVEMNRGQAGAAVRSYRQGLAKLPSSDLAVKLHQALRSNGETAQALAFEEEWLAKYASDADFMLYLGETAVQQGRNEAAERQFERAIQAGAKSPQAYNNLAWVRHLAGNPKALESAEKAYQLAPKSAPVLDTLAAIHASAGRMDRAVEFQTKAVAIEENQPNLRLHLAKYLLAAGKRAEAKTQLVRLNELGASFPDQAAVQKLLGETAK